MLSRLIRNFSTVGGGGVMANADTVNSVNRDYKGVIALAVTVSFASVAYLLKKEFDVVGLKLDMLMQAVTEGKESSKEMNRRILRLEVDKGVRDELKKLRNKKLSQKMSHDKS
jgi:hypothetical protein